MILSRMRLWHSSLVAIFLLLFTLLSSYTPVQADALDCIKLLPIEGTPDPTLIANPPVMNITAEVYSTCNYDDLIRTSSEILNTLSIGDIYIQEELGRAWHLCYDTTSMPKVNESTVNKPIGYILCRLQVGNQFDLNKNKDSSSRVGENKSTIVMRNPITGSTRSVTVQHLVIPGAAGADWFAPCSMAPSKPKVTIRATDQGVLVVVAATYDSGPPTNLFFSVTYYDSQKRVWQSWPSYTKYDVLTVTKELTPFAGSSFFAVSAKSGNRCGFSDEARENEAGNGILLAKQEIDEVKKRNPNEVFKVSASALILALKVQSTRNLSITAYSLTPDICSVSNMLLYAKSIGQCELMVESKSNETVIGVTQQISFTVGKGDNFISHTLPKKVKVGSTIVPIVRDINGTNALLTVLSPSNCSINNNTIQFLKSGLCKIESTVQETDNFMGAKSLISVTVDREIKKKVKNKIKKKKS